MTDHHPEPFGEALSHSSQRAAQIISLVSAAAQVAAHRKAAGDSRRAAGDEQAARKVAMTGALPVAATNCTRKT